MIRPSPLTLQQPPQPNFANAPSPQQHAVLTLANRQAQQQAAQDLAQQRHSVAAEKALVEAEKKAVREELQEMQRHHQNELKVPRLKASSFGDSIG